MSEAGSGRVETSNFCRTLLLTTSVGRSVVNEVTPQQHLSLSYSPYGTQQAVRPAQSHLGFNGELRERPGWYHLGKGHRVYNPVLGRFHSPDPLSPFDKGGLNPYTYCLGDPINHTDPTGNIAEFLHIAALVGYGLALFHGGISLLAPLFLKAAAPSTVAKALVGASSMGRSIGAGNKTGFLANYAALEPGMAGTPLGGLDALSSMISLVGVPIGVPTTMLSMKGHSGDALPDLMLAGAILSLSALPVKTIIVPFTPRLLEGKWGSGFSKLVHGRARVKKSWQDRADALELETLREFMAARGPSRAASVSSDSSVYSSARSSGSVRSSASYYSATSSIRSDGKRAAAIRQGP